MGNFKVFFILLAVATFAITGCNKDNAAPTISVFKVNGTETQSNDGYHTIDTNVAFEVTASDEGSLGSYQVTKEGTNIEILASGDLEGTTSTFIFNLSLNADNYAVGEEINLTFLIEDARGSIVLKPYRVIIEE